MNEKSVDTFDYTNEQLIDETDRLVVTKSRRSRMTVAYQDTRRSRD